MKLAERTPTGEPPAQLPLIVLTGLLLVLTLGVLYPASAYGLHGVAAAMLTAALLLVSGLTRRAEGPLPLATRAGRGVAVAALAWALLWAASLRWSPLPSTGRDDVVTAALGAAILLGAMLGMPSQRSADSARIAAWWLTIAIALLALFGLYQLLGGAGMPGTFATMRQQILDTVPENDPLRDGLLRVVSEGRASGTLGAPNIFASFCALAVPLAVGLALCLEGRARILPAAAALASLAGVIASGSRGGLLGTLVGLTLTAVLVLSWKRSRRQKLLFLGVVGAVGAVLFAAAFVYLNSHEVSGSRWLGRTGMTQRFYYWETAGAIWQTSPLAGRGAGAFEALYPQFRVAGSNETKHAHSWLMEYAASLGALGLLVFGLLVGAAALLVDRLGEHLARRDDRRHFLLLAGFGGGLGAMLFHGLIEYNFTFRESSQLFFLVIGLVAGWADRELSADTPAAPRAGGLLLPALAALGLLVAVLQWQLPPVRAAIAREDAGYFLTEDQNATAALEAYNGAVRLDPIDPQNWESRGLLRRQMGRADGEADLQEAAKLAPNSARLQENLARVAAEHGKLDEAIALQEKAIALHPLDVGHRLTLCEFYLNSGRPAEARKAYDTTRPLLIPTDAERRRWDAMAARLNGT